MPIGATPDAQGTHFRVWAANAQQVDVVIYEGGQPTATHALAAEQEHAGYFSAHVPGVGTGTHYLYRVDGGDPRPDPASRAQPEGVHSVSAVVDPAAFSWSDEDWRGLPLEELIIYELHVGTATPEGTFDSLIERLDYFKELGITAIELMPVADFPGHHNWGYDGVNLFAPSRNYGGAEGLRRLVDAAHARGLAVLLDVVYNHLGPDGNYLRQFSLSYFTDRHHTPWGDAVNMDGPDSRPVRDYFIANVCHWAHEYHIDGLRLDATHAIIDESPTHILAEMADSVRLSLPPDRRFVLIAESELNNPNLVRPAVQGGIGLDGVWADDFHHQVRVALAGDRDGYYMDYSGSAPDLAATIEQGWFYTGQVAPHSEQPRGAPADDVPLPRFVYCIQNHDQVGNRAMGDRLHHTISPQAYAAASTLLLLTPATPLLWMGQEWATSSPFIYFTDHNPELGRMVTEGRRSEFAAFASFSGEQVPDPQALATFEQSKLNWQEQSQPQHSGMLQLYRDLLDLRRRLPALRERDRTTVSVAALGDDTLALRRSSADASDTLLLLVHLGKSAFAGQLGTQPITRAPDGQHWTLLLDSGVPRYVPADSQPDDAPGIDPANSTVSLTAPRALLFQAAQ
jgi:maltooligosyltrehalose trehalohydrolase